MHRRQSYFSTYMCLFNCRRKNKKIIYANVYRNTINDGDSQTSPLPIFPEGGGRSVRRLAGRGARKLVIVKWLQTMILYCLNITYQRKLHLISSSRPNPLGSCGQSSSSRLFAPCYHSLPRFPSLARRLSCPTNVG